MSIVFQLLITEKNHRSGNQRRHTPVALPLTPAKNTRATLPRSLSHYKKAVGPWGMQFTCSGLRAAEGTGGSSVASAIH